MVSREPMLIICFFSSEKLGRILEEINFIAKTHRDRDHVQGNKMVNEKTKAKSAIPRRKTSYTK